MGNDFRWRSLSDKDKAAIAQEAKGVMDDFKDKLERISGELDKVSLEEDLGSGTRSEGESADASFSRETFFANAPRKDEKKGVLLAEKKKW